MKLADPPARIRRGIGTIHPLKPQIAEAPDGVRAPLVTATKMERMAAGNISVGSFSSHGSQNSVIQARFDHFVDDFDFVAHGRPLFSLSFILQLQFSILSLQLRRRRFLKAGEGGFRPKLPPTP
ncbi:hypothetical protein U8P76_05975 [Rhizobium johnstonii]|nr:hypothetical protein U8P76_05975 [Rhizobium johnstonii]